MPPQAETNDTAVVIPAGSGTASISINTEATGRELLVECSCQDNPGRCHC